MPTSDDPWDVEQLRLPDSLVGDLARTKRPPRHRPGETFIKGPIPHAWVASASRLPGSGLAVVMVARFLRGRYRYREGWSLAEIGERLGVSPDTVRRALVSAEGAGLVVVERSPGCKPMISLPPTAKPTPRKSGEPKPLYGPIPWAWWYAASRLPTPALRVALACWLVAGWQRAAEVELELGAWSDLGLSRSAASRGLVALREAGLVAVESRPGRSPMVSILPVTPSGAGGDRTSVG